MQLHFKTYGEGEPLLILHGLLGSLDNWNTLAKKFAKHYKVYSIDQRNHGKSPHTCEFNYPLLVEDLKEFCTQQQLEKINLLGHSMGGKVAMLFAHTYPEKLNKLIIADIAPVKYEPSHTLIFRSLSHIMLSNKTEREEVDEELALTIENNAVRMFLMKGLTRDKDNNFKWRYNISSLWDNYDAILDTFPVESPYAKKVLFIRGERSDYIQEKYKPMIDTYFSNYKIITIEGVGHWLHAEKPKEFLSHCLAFLQEN